MPLEAMRDVFDIAEGMPNLGPRFNVAPSQQAPIVVADENGVRSLRQMRWGLVPHWSKGPDNRFSMINARAETVADKPAFRDAYRQRHCLVPMDGFYEWRKESGQKQPYRITMQDMGLFACAGLWERWEGPDESVSSFTIIVTDANDFIRPIHDRMPVVVAPGDYGAWLTPGSDLREIPTRPSSDYAAYRVSRRVNSSANDDAQVAEPVDA